MSPLRVVLMVWPAMLAGFSFLRNLRDQPELTAVDQHGEEDEGQDSTVVVPSPITRKEDNIIPSQLSLPTSSHRPVSEPQPCTATTEDTIILNQLSQPTSSRQLVSEPQPRTATTDTPSTTILSPTTNPDVSMVPTTRIASTFETKFSKERGETSNFSSSSEQERGLLNTMFSWSLHDVFNKNLLQNEVKKIPKTFTSLEHYLGSYTLPLIEEVHADLCSSLEVVSHAPFIKIQSVKEIKHNKQLMYKIVVAGPGPIGNGTYEPKVADIFILSEIRPRQVSDLTRTGRSYIIASVIKVVNDGRLPATNFIIKPSQPLEVEKYCETQRAREPLFAVFLLNMTTYNRIWMSLDLKSATQRNTNIINYVKSYNSSAVKEPSSSSLAVSTHHLHDAKTRDSLNQFKLNDSQANAVLDCISVKQQHQKYSVKMIWGPPGTGKTKTISTLLQILLTKNCRTITCTPTNTAVVEVASRLVKLVRESSSSSTCSLGNVVLFGNEDRMKIDDTLSEVFLDNRVDRLLECFTSLTGWRHCFKSMINFLEDCVKQYTIYMEKEEEEEQEEEEKKKEQEEFQDDF